MALNKTELTARLQEAADFAVMSSHAFTKSVPSNTLASGGVSAKTDNNNSSSVKSSSLEKASWRKGSYKDYSRVPPHRRTPPVSTALSQAALMAKEPTFPVKLHQILANPEFHDVICWLPHGRSWRILQQKAFEERIIPLYFRHGRYSSFARQVNGWGFRRVTHGSDYNSYYHEMFLRGMPHLCESMRRLTTKDSAARRNSEEEPAPDFYKISRANPLPEDIPTTRPAIPESSRFPLLTGSFNGMLMGQQRADLLDQLNTYSASNRVLQQQQSLSSFRPGFGDCGGGLLSAGNVVPLTGLEDAQLKQLMGIGSPNRPLGPVQKQQSFLPCLRGGAGGSVLNTEPNTTVEKQVPLNASGLLNGPNSLARLSNFHHLAADRKRTTMTTGLHSPQIHDTKTAQLSQLLAMTELLKKNATPPRSSNVSSMHVPSGCLSGFGGTNM